MPFISGVTGSKGYAGIGINSADEPEYKGTTMVFPQAAAPLGWVQVTTYNDVGLRLTNAGGATNAFPTVTGTGGSNPFSSQYPATPASLIFQDLQWPFSASTTYTALAQMAAHVHGPATGYNVASTTPTAIGAAVPYANLPTTTPKFMNPTGPFGGMALNPAATSLNAAGVAYTLDFYISPLKYGTPYSPTNLTGFTNAQQQTSPGEGHSHDFNGGFRITSTNVNMNIKYISAILAKRK
jgi:hypothetical protein